ncbi:hypothetical protein BT67DRAFT_85211 [Trichocladium antarcticum]|uniref:Uncharacterized protein n=1 Tax=Trichocladium antarcticum TaxID=1450529 RepID=A0AAN6UGH5_9PEZI|nr:hypothetical protein BT67DRAFT_85211 [Trichocladium antarcticum]
MEAMFYVSKAQHTAADACVASSSVTQRTIQNGSRTADSPISMMAPFDVLRAASNPSYRRRGQASLLGPGQRNPRNETIGPRGASGMLRWRTRCLDDAGLLFVSSIWVVLGKCLIKARRPGSPCYATTLLYDVYHPRASRVWFGNSELCLGLPVPPSWGTFLAVPRRP